MNFSKDSLSLYLITDNGQLRGRDFFQVIENSINGGVTMVQIREKNLTSKEYFEKALKLKELTTKYNVPFIVNDRLDIALAVGADGVHVGQKDIPVSYVRKVVGNEIIVGATANTVELAVLAEKQGANYIGVGAVFGTSTKLDAKPLSIQELEEIVKSVNIPVVAIGGIELSNVGKLKDTGICGVAVSSGIMSADDVCQHTKSFLEKL